MRVHVSYFAVLREQRGLSEETLDTTSGTFGELYEELRARHNFTLPLNLVRPAKNGAFVDMNDRLADDDRVVFIPPVAGG